MEANAYVYFKVFHAQLLITCSPSLPRRYLLPLRRRCRLWLRCDKARPDRRGCIQKPVHKEGAQG
jgi:hypothetical protein